MSISHHTSSDPSADPTLPITLAPAANAPVGGRSEFGPDESAATNEQGIVEPIEYRHVVLPVAGATRVRYSQVEELKPRRFHLDGEM